LHEIAVTEKKAAAEDRYLGGLDARSPFHWLALSCCHQSSTGSDCAGWPWCVLAWIGRFGRLAVAPQGGALWLLHERRVERPRRLAHSWR